MKIKTLIFDLGEVLIYEHPKWGAKKFSEINGLSVSENMKIMKDDLEYMKGNITPSGFASKYMKSMNLDISEEEFHTIYSDVFTLDEPLFDFLKELKGKVDLTMLSNTEEVRIIFLKKKFPELFSLFGDRLALSYEVHVVKPQKEIYHHALKIADVKPENSVFIDDKIEYVEAAKKLGMKALQYTTVESLKNYLEKII